MSTDWLRFFDVVVAFGVGWVVFLWLMIARFFVLERRTEARARARSRELWIESLYASREARIGRHAAGARPDRSVRRGPDGRFVGREDQDY